MDGTLTNGDKVGSESFIGANVGGKTGANTEGKLIGVSFGKVGDILVGVKIEGKSIGVCPGKDGAMFVGEVMNG